MIKLECELRKNDKLIKREMVGGIKLQAFAEVKSKEGVILEEKEIKCNSFVRQFMEMLFIQAGTVNYTIRDVGNALSSTGPHASNMRSTAGVGDGGMGIIVGIGTATPTINDFRLQTPIVHGTAAGQLQYGGQDFEAPASPDANTSFMGYRRAFTNGSGATVTIREIGIYVFTTDGVWWQGHCLIARDLIPSGLVVPNLATATITYRIVVTVPGFTRQFINIISRQIRHVGVSGVNIANTADGGGSHVGNLRCVGSGGRSASEVGFRVSGEDIGIVLGTGTTAVNTNDWRLATKIVHGRSAEQLIHFGTYAEDFITISANTGTFRIERAWENVSGASITVNEIGLYSQGGGSLFQTARHLVSPGVVVANGEMLRATYTVSITT